MEKNTVIKYVMGFESWEGEYTAVQLINNNGLTRVLAGCFLWAAQPPPRRMLQDNGSRERLLLCCWFCSPCGCSSPHRALSAGWWN